jgi:hypothetical protein
MVLQFSCFEGLCGIVSAAYRSGQGHRCQHPRLRAGKEYIQQRTDGRFCAVPGQPEHQKGELAYLGRSRGEWGLGLTDLARDQIVNAVGFRLILLYRLIGPTAVIVIMVMFIVGMVRMLIDILVRTIIIARVAMGLLDVWSSVGHCFPGGGVYVLMGRGER